MKRKRREERWRRWVEREALNMERTNAIYCIFNIALYHFTSLVGKANTLQDHNMQYDAKYGKKMTTVRS
jgi:hypothetical protein